MTASMYMPRVRALALGCWLALAAGCAAQQVPEALPRLANPDLERRLTRLLRYDVPVIGADSLRRLASTDVLILDAREPVEYAVSHIPGAVQIDPKGKLPAWIDEVPRARQVTVYCSVGYRSENLARRLEEAGFTKVSNLYGSIFDWVDRGLPLEDSDGNATHRIHTYNQRWSRLVTSPDAEKVW